MARQRQAFRKGELAGERIQRLERFGFVWDTRGVAWEQGFAALEAFKLREGHIRVPQRHQEDGFGLGGWVGKQRTDRRRDELGKERIQRLEALGFVWDPFAEDWEQGFAALEAFKLREGHIRVPAKHQESGIMLGAWVGTQRNEFRKGELASERIQRLEELGFVWDVLAEAWEQGFAALEAFKQREGHLRVPRTLRESGLGLGGWVRRQRQAFRKGELASERIQRLEELGFPW